MKKLDIFLLIYKILLLVLVVAVLAWGVYCEIDYVNSARIADDSDFGESFGNAIGIVVVLLLTVIFDAALIVLALPGLIVSLCRKTNPTRKRDIIHFALLTASPAVSFGVFYVIMMIATNMVSNM